MPRALSLLTLLAAACTPSSPAPTADAGARVTGNPGEVFYFDASASKGEGLRYAWMLLDGPAEADLLDAHTDAALLVPSAEGEYRLAVEVCDRWGRCDVAETVALVGELAQRAGVGGFGAVSFGGASFAGPSFAAKKPWGKNQAPEAQATGKRSLGALGTVKLDGSASSDPDGDALRYRWQLVSRPTGSVLTTLDISDRTTATASFTADATGPYGFKLTVRDGALSDSVTLPDITLGAIDYDDPID
jgi:hypothetical protein